MTEQTPAVNDEAVSAAARAAAPAIVGESFDSLNPHRQRALLSDFARYLTAALPFLSQQVDPREQIRAEALAPVAALHRPRIIGFLTGDCAAEDCEHEDECPTTPLEVCAECWDVCEEVHGIYWAEGNGPKDVVMWPCATAAVLADPEDAARVARETPLTGGGES